MQWLVDQRLGAQHIMSYRLVIDPGETASHAHDGTEEALYVVEGAGNITVESITHVVAPGNAVFIPAGCEHSYESTGDDAPVMRARATTHLSSSVRWPPRSTRWRSGP